MASSTGYLPVDGPRPGEPRVSLLATAKILGRIIEGSLTVTSADDLPAEGEPDDLRGRERWVNGITFRPSYCGEGGSFTIPCVASNNTVASRPTNVEFQPIEADVWVDCSSLSESDRDDVGQAAIQLLNVRQHGIIAAEFWRGDVAQSTNPDLPNNYLAKSPTELASGAAVAAVDALAALEEGLAGNGAAACGGGVRSMIHASANTVTVWNFLGLLRNEGGLLLTALDTVVVTGPGYDGSDPDGDVDDTGETAWAYGTGMVDVYLGRPTRIPNYVDRDVNTVNAYASRPYAVVWDGCCDPGINVNLAERG